MPTFSQNLTLQETFQTSAQINKELKKTESNGTFSKKKQKTNVLSIEFPHFFAQRKKSVEKMIHQKKNRGHLTSTIIESRQSYTNGGARNSDQYGRQCD